MPEKPGVETPRGANKEIAGNPQANGANAGPAEPVDPAVEAATPDVESSEGVDLTRLVTTAMVMTYVSALAVSAEYAGYNDVLPQIPEMVASSMGHPAVGYIGGGAAGLAAIRFNKSPAVRTTAIFAAASLANLFVEKAQSLAVASPEYIDFMSRQNLPETSKDYVAALLGATLLAFQIRR